MEPYDSKTVAKLLGISLRQLQYWDEQGIVSPSVRKARGKGTARMYSFKDLVQLKVVKKLRDNNISLKKIKKSIEHLKKEMPNIDEPLAELSFITDGDSIFKLTDDPKIIIDILRSGQLTWNIPFKKIVQEIITIKKAEADINFHMANLCIEH